METDLTDRYARRLKGTIPDREIRGWRPYAGRFGGVAATSRGETWIRLWCDPLVYEEESSGRPKVYLWSRLSVLFRLDIAQATALAVVVGDSGASRPERKPPMTHLELYRELLSPTFPAALAYGDYQKVAEAAAARVRDGRMPKREVACALQRSFGDAGLDWALYEECNTDGYYTAKVRRLRPWAAEVYEGIGSFGFSVDFNFPIAMLWRIRFTVDVPVPAWYDQFKAKVIETMDQLVTAVSAQRPSALRGLA